MTGKGTGGSDAFLLGAQECKSVVSALGSEVIPAAIIIGGDKRPAIDRVDLKRMATHDIG